ncbi:MAG: ABC transporter permease [Roseateles asaccharophilus]|uniref:Peptide/nickel transport system permease protein n=1 Tax=Roseateles asaccharophilus TaxID=582607 RepID=A0A4R6N9Z9_9BURK|nr:ABC transporter permease [Roseateles asaccharophilus]MDN3544861.1 ABC transporter permease [Roseateles asaccharophilus]TDP12752.1 peptide/nickel transport system permease protein [Roseateles asaccharophilus]
MSLFLARRLATLLLTLLAASLLVFAVLEVLPGNAAQLLMGPDAAPEAVAALADKLGLNQPAWQRYGQWLLGLLRFDLGLSYAYGSPVAELIAERLALTVPLALLAMMLTTAIALSTGLYAAARHGRPGDTGVMLLSQLGIAVPSFWFAILLILLFSVKLQWIPAGGFPGWREAEGGGLWPGLQALILPALALAVVQAAILARITRSAMLEVLREDFMRTARAKGLSPRQALWGHGLRNAMIPVLTVMGLQFANLLAGTIVVENVFYLPGLGRLIFQSIANRDLIVVRNCVLLLAVMVILVNFVVDVLYAWIDPRIKTTEL